MERLVHSLVCCIPSAAKYRYRVNWFVIFSGTFLNGLTLLIQSPSLHQFITSSNNHTTDDIEPGLNLTETWYSVIVSVVSIGTVIGAILFGIVAKHVYFKFGLLVELLISLGGGIIYSFGESGWLILLSRFLTGLFLGIHMSLMRIYVLETSEKLISTLPLEKQPKSTIKYTAMFVLFLHGNLGTVYGPIVVAIAAHIPSISSFHWPGYYISAHSFCLIVLVIFIFNERWDDITRRRKTVEAKESRGSYVNKFIKEFKNPSVPHYLSLAFIYLFFIFGWNLAILETLQSPILSDLFGLDIKAGSYVFIGVVSVHFVSVVITYVLQKLRVDNRHILIMYLVLAIAGTIIMTDWQSLSGDPCTKQFTLNDSTTQRQLDNSSSDCEMISHDCFWNPLSRITGDYCVRCRQVCLSKSHTLNLAQFVTGMVLLASCMAPGRLLVTTIASDIAKGSGQPMFLIGILVAAGDLSKAVGPLWANPTYLLVGHRTWLPMSIMTALQIVGLTLVIIFYRKMKKRTLRLDDVNMNGSSKVNDSSISEQDTIELLAMEEVQNTEDSPTPDKTENSHL